MGNNIMGSKLLELLSGIDKSKLEEAKDYFIGFYN